MSGVIALALTASHDEGRVVRSRFKHQLSQHCLKLAQNFVNFMFHGNALLPVLLVAFRRTNHKNGEQCRWHASSATSIHA